MRRQTIYLKAVFTIEGDDALVAASAIREWLEGSSGGVPEFVLDILGDAPFAYFPEDEPPPTDWYFGEGRVELDTSPLSLWQTSVN